MTGYEFYDVIQKFYITIGSENTQIYFLALLNMVEELTEDYSLTEFIGEMPEVNNFFVGNPNDVLYLTRTGNKELSPYALNLYNFSTINSVLTNVDEVDVLKLINSISLLYENVTNTFYDKWNAIYNSLKSEYNPIHNYDMSEEEKVGSKISTSSDVKVGTYGFNSSTSVPQSDNNSSTVSEGNKEDNVRELTRKGNIGVTSSQNLIEQEIDLRTKHKMLEIIFEDLDSLLFSDVYSI